MPEDRYIAYGRAVVPMIRLVLTDILLSRRILRTFPFPCVSRALAHGCFIALPPWNLPTSYSACQEAEIPLHHMNFCVSPEFQILAKHS